MNRLTRSYQRQSDKARLPVQGQCDNEKWFPYPLLMNRHIKGVRVVLALNSLFNPLVIHVFAMR